MKICKLKWNTLAYILFQIFNPTKSATFQNLGGEWNVKNEIYGYDLPATVPGGIYSDLMQNDVISDVFYGFNDLDTRWVSKTDWNYSRSFNVGEEFHDYTNINLVFDGVDTFTTILINNVEIGGTENMFVRYIFDVKPYLQVGNNNISVLFRSPVRTAKELYEKQARDYSVPPVCVPDKYNGECHVNHIRKMQASFSWDWGPAFPSVGIWKKVYLEAYNSTLLRDVTVDISSNKSLNYWNVQVNVYLADNSKTDSIEGTLITELLTDVENITIVNKVNVKKNVDGEFFTTHQLTVPKVYVHLWWPNGYGSPKLYTMKVSFTSSDRTESNDKVMKIGFRTVELVQNLIESGRTFYFKVNDVPIFAKGSNSIPINILPELGYDKNKVRFLLESARDVHMNMLRVWGGGVYESNTFYELADEFGILIWQDFMFACSMYPTNDEFLRTVIDEVKHQVRRLQHHPSIILWSGNNENEAALRQNWYGTLGNFSLYKDDYIKLYVDTIEKHVLINDNTRPFLTSSPTNGIESEKEDYIAKNPQSHFYGDVHFYNYVFDSWKKNTYPINRFASEYGYQSLPSIETLLTATNDTKDLEIDSRFLTSRQHHQLGYLRMQILAGYQLKLPRDNNKNFYKAFIFYSQVVQAMAVKTETEYYRQWRSNLNKAGKGLTMGALYWQLNDVWAAPSWSGIDFKNNWKMLHYFAKNFFAPVIVTTDTTEYNKLDIYVVSDLLKPIFNASVNVIVYRWDSFVPVFQQTIQTDVLPSLSRKLGSYQFNKLLLSASNSMCGEDASQNCFVYFTLHDDNKQIVAPDNFLFPPKLRSAHLQKATIKISNIKEVDETNFIVEVESDAIALFVWLNVKEIRGRFSDNGFLQVTEKRTVHFYSQQPIQIEELKDRIGVTHLLDDDYL